MEKYWHSVRLEKDLCHGCTNCLKSCPTQAIRIQGEKAKILNNLCIDCGECIRKCPYHAKKAVTDSLSELNKFKYNVALIAPAFYGQFSKAESIDDILSAVLNLGFDDVFEVAVGAEVISRKTDELLLSGELLKPAISSACPAVMKLIAIMFPGLIQNIVPLKSPMEVSATEARRLAIEKSVFSKDEIGIFFISPCAAKMTIVKDSVFGIETDVDGVLSIKDIVLKMAQNGVGKIDDVKPLSAAGEKGVLWATTGGEAESSGAKKHVSASGIQNVIKLLAEIEDGKLSEIDFVEVLACEGGCVGGPLVSENPFVASSRIKRLCHKLESKNTNVTTDLYWQKPIIYRPVMKLDADRKEAMRKAALIEEIFENLPKLDCGSCGSPSCKALAEDIVKGYADESDCIFKLRERFEELREQMVELKNNTM